MGKELVEAHCAGRSAVLDDYRRLELKAPAAGVCFATATRTRGTAPSSWRFGERSRELRSRARSAGYDGSHPASTRRCGERLAGSMSLPAGYTFVPGAEAC